MPGPGELLSHERLIGREAGLARLRGLVDPVPQASQVLLVTGEAGIGNTVLLADVAVAQEVTLKAVTSFTENTTYSRPFERFINRVNQDGKGILRINYIGGPKAMPTSNGGIALGPPT